MNCEVWVDQICSKPQPAELHLDLINEDILYDVLRDELIGIPSGQGQIQKAVVDLDEKSRTGSIKAWDSLNNQVLNLDLCVEDDKTLLIDELKISDGVDVSRINYGQKGRGVCNPPLLAGLIFALVPIAYEAGFKNLRNDPATQRLAVFYESTFGFKKGQFLSLDRNALMKFCKVASILRRFRGRKGG